ncbi:MAG: phage portal protein, partial [Clostridium sp.]
MKIGIIKNIISSFRNEVEEGESIGTNPSLEQLQAFFKTDIENISESKLTSTTYYSCMLIRCNAIAKLSLKLVQETENGTIKALKHPLYKILRKRPNKFTNTHDFLWATEFQRLEHGNAYWVADSDARGDIKGIYLLDSTRVTIMIDNTGILNANNAVYYVYTDEKKGNLIYTSDNIVHFKNFSKDGIKGTS